jgi:hypothetical protein
MSQNMRFGNFGSPTTFNIFSFRTKCKYLNITVSYTRHNRTTIQTARYLTQSFSLLKLREAQQTVHATKNYIIWSYANREKDPHKTQRANEPVSGRHRSPPNKISEKNSFYKHWIYF